MSNTTLTRSKRTNAGGPRGDATAPPRMGEQGAYATILVDPPWPTGQRNGPRNKGFGAERHYPLMSIEEIAKLPIDQLAAENAHLYMWCYPATRHIAEDLMRGFGFRFVDEFQWLKIPLGLGAYWRHSHETLILGVKGRLPAQFHGQPSWAIHPRQDHSHKPEEIHKMIERLSPGPRLEMFARRPYPGWHIWGNEVNSDIVISGYPVPSDARHEATHD